MRNKLMIIISIICCMTSSCSNENLSDLQDNQTSMILSVQTNEYSRALVEKDFFNTNAQLAVKLVNAGTTVDYSSATSFLQYNHSSSNGSFGYTGWSLNSGSCYLGAKSASVYAYYPYDTNKKDFTAIPVESGDIDYMYGTSVEDVSAKQNYAMLKMHHALAVVRVAVKLGNAKKKSISSISVQSAAFSQKGTMNVFTGQLSDFSGDYLAKTNYSSNKSLSSSVLNNDFILVPNGVSAPLIIRITDSYGVVSEIVTEPVILHSGYIHTIEVSYDYGGEMSYDKIEISNWGYDNSGSVNYKMGNYTVSCVGDMDGIVVNSETINDKMIIHTLPTLSYNTVNNVTVSGSVISQQNASADISGARIITLSNINSDVILSFNGCTSSPVVGYIDLEQNTLQNGVYVVAANGLGVNIADADESCVGVALVVNDARIPQRFMIEKNERRNPAYINDGRYYWGSTSYNTSVSDYSTVDGTSSYSNGGYLPKPDGTTSGTVHLSADYKTWTSGAISDFNGKTNSQSMISTSKSTEHISGILDNFNNATDYQNLGYTDWYIPACGQLCLIHLNIIQINEALNKINGFPFSYTTYWSSTEVNSTYAYYISVGYGSVYGNRKTNAGSYPVRFIRDIIE